MSKAKQQPIIFTLLFFLACAIFRAIEYFVIRTDQSIIGEAFIHKLIGIALLALAVRMLHYRLRDVGFDVHNMGRNIGLGLLLAGVVFAVGYGVEMIVQTSAGNAPSLQFFVTSYAIQGNRGMQGGIIFIAICIIGNLINVIMEEGVFRGLFLKVMGEKYSFWKSCLLASSLFGIWHIAQPVRNMLDGVQSPMGAFMSGLLLVVTSTLLGIQYCMLFQLTGSLWAGMTAHFINNAGTNLLHVVTVSGIDELQTIRIAIAQTLSFAIVLIVFLYQRYRAKRK